MLWRSLDRRRRALLVGSLLSVTLHAFDELSVVTALPVISADLDGRSLYGAVFYAYLLASILGLVGAGWLASRHGPARPFGAGLGLFVIGLAAAAVAPDMITLVASRALQGLGGGVISTVVLVVVNRAFDEDERPRVMALNSAAWVMPALVAPAAAGAIAEHVGWRFVFAAPIPFAALAAALALPAMRHIGPGTTDRSAGAALLDGARLAAGVGLLLLGLGRAFDLRTLAAILAGLWLCAGPARRILPAGVWLGRSALGGAVGVKMFVVFAFFGAEAFVPLAVRDVHGATATLGGLVLTAAALSWTAGSFLQSRIAASTSARVIAATGAALVLIGIAALLPLLDPATPLWVAFAAWGVAGLGMGLVYNGATVAAMAATPAGAEGSTSTALGVADSLAISLGTGLGGAVIAFGDRAAWSTADSLQRVWLALAAFTLLTVWRAASTGLPDRAAPVPT